MTRKNVSRLKNKSFAGSVKRGSVTGIAMAKAKRLPMKTTSMVNDYADDDDELTHFSIRLIKQYNERKKNIKK